MRNLLLATVALVGLASAAHAQSSNQAYIEQTGSYMTGSGAVAYQEQSGTANNAYISQQSVVGASASQKQVGTANIAQTSQVGGTGNAASTTQIGTGHQFYISQIGGASNQTTHSQDGNSGAGHYASSYMTGQTSSIQSVTQYAPDGYGSSATQQMLAAGGNNVQTILQTGRGSGNTATQILR